MRYRDIDMPEVFILEGQDSAGEWIDWGLFEAQQFGRNDDGTYVCSGHGGSPVFLRCLEQRGDLIDVVDGTGERFTKRLVPFPSDRYRPKDPDL